MWPGIICSYLVSSTQKLLQPSVLGKSHCGEPLAYFTTSKTSRHTADLDVYTTWSHSFLTFSLNPLPSPPLKHWYVPGSLLSFLQDCEQQHKRPCLFIFAFLALSTGQAKGRHLTSICQIEMNMDSNLPIYQFLLPGSQTHLRSRE